jgi:hypothetical protein
MAEAGLLERGDLWFLYSPRVRKLPDPPTKSWC